MEITEIRIKLMEESEDRLRAFCSITLDDSFVVRDLKIIDGTSGPFVAMPSRKLAGHCPRCGYKNHLRAAYCNNCGGKQPVASDTMYDSPQKLYADVAHPINSVCREMIQNAVLQEFEAELRRAAQPGYRSRYDDDFDDDLPLFPEEPTIARPGARTELSRSGETTYYRDEVAGRDVSRPNLSDQQGRGQEGRGQPQREKSAAEDDDEFGAGIL